MISRWIVIFIFLFFILLQGGYAQSPFNKIYDMGFHQQNVYALSEIDNFYVVSGQIGTEDSISQSGIFFSKFDLNGNLIETNFYVDTLSPYVFF